MVAVNTNSNVVRIASHTCILPQRAQMATSTCGIRLTKTCPFASSPMMVSFLQMPFLKNSNTTDGFSEPLDPPIGDREEEDVGVKFVAWGMSPDRLYTGGSDGTVRVWNVRSAGNPLVRVLYDAPAAVVYGRFSPNLQKLLIGDAQGDVFLFTTSEEDNSPGKFISVGGSNGRRIRTPTHIIPHEEPPPPSGSLRERTGAELARHYIQTGQLYRHPDESVGVVQGPNYSQTGLFRVECHDNEDPMMPLRVEFEFKQRRNSRPVHRSRSQRRWRSLNPATDATERLHKNNVKLDLDVGLLSEEARKLLSQEKAELTLHETDCRFVYEEPPVDTAVEDL